MGHSGDDAVHKQNTQKEIFHNCDYLFVGLFILPQNIGT